MGKDIAPYIIKENFSKIVDLKDSVVLKGSNIKNIPNIVHSLTNRCGGFIVHDNLDEALTSSYRDRKIIPMEYRITKSDLVIRSINRVSESNVFNTINYLSSFKNRYYTSDTGYTSAVWLKDKWSKLTSSRSDFSVSLFEHPSWKQPSVLATLKGRSDEIVVVGGHIDSISRWYRGNNASAPGADDNASGMASITETIRILAESNYVPKRTIVFAGYAAEEVGLKGSSAIAKKFKADKKNVIGVMQLDMTNFKGSDKSIYLISDFTDKEQSSFLGQLIDRYLKVPWGYIECGYACSDHASWSKAGYSTVFPFETTMQEVNPDIHSDRDVLGDSADHAALFAKLALAYIIELGK